MEGVSLPESCARCPHFDAFHGTCEHPRRQEILDSLKDDPSTCPVYRDVYAEAMRDLSASLEESSHW